MSHVASVQCYVQDLTVLRAVAERLGLELVEGAKTYNWYGQWVGDFRGATAAVDNGHDPRMFGKCEHKLRRADAASGDYEIGLVNRLDGQPGFELVYDNWGHGGRRIEEKAGKGLTTLKNELACEVAIRVQARAGYRAMRKVEPDGSLTLTFVK